MAREKTVTHIRKKKKTTEHGRGREGIRGIVFVCVDVKIIEKPHGPIINTSVCFYSYIQSVKDYDLSNDPTRLVSS